MSAFSDLDQRFMAACLRYARRHEGLTGTNPSVGTFLVRGDVIVGRGVTAKGGRPHAESQAISQAGHLSHGATAYVSLEPCAHHGATPPCAQALIDAGIVRVVTAWTDPDTRVDGKGHGMLREAGVAVDTGLLGTQASSDMAGYLARKQKNRPHVTLKLAVSKDGKLGISGQEIAITGALAKSYVHRMRSVHDAIMVGRGTVVADDPDLTCRLSGLENRSPHRFILAKDAASVFPYRLCREVSAVPTTVITSSAADTSLSNQPQVPTTRLMMADCHGGNLALPEILEDMAALGYSSLMVEGGARVAQSFLEQNLVSTVALFSSDSVVGDAGLASPFTLNNISPNFKMSRQLSLGQDRLTIFDWKDAACLPE